MHIRDPVNISQQESLLSSAGFLFQDIKEASIVSSLKFLHSMVSTEYYISLIYVLFFSFSYHHVSTIPSLEALNWDKDD